MAVIAKRDGRRKTEARASGRVATTAPELAGRAMRDLKLFLNQTLGGFVKKFVGDRPTRREFFIYPDEVNFEIPNNMILRITLDYTTREEIMKLAEQAGV
jgi:hypothetical protein